MLGVCASEQHWLKAKSHPPDNYVICRVSLHHRLSEICFTTNTHTKKFMSNWPRSCFFLNQGQLNLKSNSVRCISSHGLYFLSKWLSIWSFPPWPLEWICPSAREEFNLQIITPFKTSIDYHRKDLPPWRTVHWSRCHKEWVLWLLMSY